MQHKGAPYRWGGEGLPASIAPASCATSTLRSASHSLTTPPSSIKFGTPVTRSDLQPGDLVFFDRLRHNGIYIGEGRFIHSRQTGKHVAVASLDDDWYRTHWVGGRRL